MKKAIAFSATLMLGVAAISTANAAQVYDANGYPFGTAGYDQYQGPHGGYMSQTGFIRSLNGTPCGIACSERARERWQLGR